MCGVRVKTNEDCIMDGTYMTNGELAAIQAEKSIDRKLKVLEDRINKLELRLVRLELRDVRLK